MNRTQRAAALTAALLTASLALPLAQAATVEIHILNAQFGPATVNIQAGDTVEFVNDDSFAHDVVFEAGFGTGAAGSLAPQGRWNHTFDANGTFKFRCQLHSANFDTNMVGKVVVGQAPAPPPPKSPGFEVLGALAAIGAVALLRARGRA